MCFDDDSHPPIDPIAGAAIEHEVLELRAADGNRLAAFHALAERPSGIGMLVLPDVRGLFPYYEELALRFAELGVDALAIDYYGRTAGPGTPGRPLRPRTAHQALHLGRSAGRRAGWGHGHPRGRRGSARSTRSASASVAASRSS